MNDRQSPEDAAGLAASRRKLLSIIAIAVVPIVIAYFMFFYFPAIVPEGTTNKGVLITPPQQIESLSVALATDNWVLIQLVNDDCDEACQHVMNTARQVHKAIGKEASRLSRAVVSRSPLSMVNTSFIAAEHPGLQTVVDAEVWQALAVLAQGDTENTVFLMDPNGNVMMYYQPEKVGKPLMQDIRHLLRISNIG
jgi:hypothetical protein